MVMFARETKESYAPIIEYSTISWLSPENVNNDPDYPDLKFGEIRTYTT